MSRCRSCEAAVLWVDRLHDGVIAGPLLLNAEPVEVESGWELIEQPGKGPVAKYSPKGIRRPLYIAHFATCPQAKGWRGAGKKKP